MLLALPDILEGVFAFLFGAVTGSFLNVVVHRVPRRESIVAPRSRCPGCETLIAWYDNIPIASWLLLRARCRHCGARIAVRYVLVEIANASLWVAAWWYFGATIDGLVAAAFLSSMLALGAIDLEHYILPDRITIPGILAGLGCSFVVSWNTPRGALAGTLAGAAVLMFIMGVYWLVRRTEGMGWGDVKMLAMIGAFLGWKGMIVTLFLSTVTGAAVGLSLIAVGWAGERAVEEGEGEGFGLALPFGAFLSVGAAAALFLGPGAVDMYLRFSGILPPS